MIRTDMEAVLAIEQRCFATYAWAQEDFTNLLKRKQSIGLVCERDGYVVGYSVHVVDGDTYHLARLAVDPLYQRAGVGRELVERIMLKMNNHDQGSIVAEVREYNTSAQLFFKRMGFRATAIENDFFDDGEASYRMQFGPKPVYDSGRRFQNRITEFL